MKEKHAYPLKGFTFQGIRIFRGQPMYSRIGISLLLNFTQRNIIVEI